MKNYLNLLFDELCGRVDFLDRTEIQFNIPQDDANGDFSTNIAMLLSKKLKKNPREIAQNIIDELNADTEVIEKIEIAGPGFINFYFSPKYVNKIIKQINENGSRYGYSEKFKGKRANVEFVSANPTGPLTVGHGRNAVLGDTIACLLEAVGYEVDREYYFNNAGRQMRVLGDSVKTRYRELIGEKVEFPEDYYQGEYIIDIAKNLLESKGADLKEKDDLFKESAEKFIFDDIKKTLSSIGINFDRYFNEDDLYKKGDIKSLLEFFEQNQLSYLKDGAVWLKFTELGQETDKVIVKSSGEPTYRLPDIAYHKTKFDRNYDLMIDIFGSDHSATYPDVMAGVRALGYDSEKVKVIIHQFVTITEKGDVVKMSTRKANFITLDELIEEVGSDVVRYFFIMRNYSSHMNFDIDLAKKHSDENPVFYLKYAHARIASIIRMTKDEGLNLSFDNLDLLSTDIEQKLIKMMHRYNDELTYSAENYEPHKLTSYLENLAALFHKFYTECRIIGSDKDVAEARIALILAVKTILNNGLSILKIEAPERM